MTWHRGHQLIQGVDGIYSDGRSTEMRFWDLA